MGGSKRTYTLISIATNIYVEYWKNMIISMLNSCGETRRLQIVVCTEQIESLSRWAVENIPAEKIIFLEIPNYKWPEATLLRYEVLAKLQQMIRTEVCIYIDCDMEITADLIRELDEMEIGTQMHFAPHPGYIANPHKNDKKVTSKISHIYPKRLFSRYRGAWETRRNSKAFIPKHLRKTYLHGAFWFGQRETFFAFVNLCATNTGIDLENQVIAKWHDESHLNSYYTNFGGSILSSKFSWHPKYSKILDPHPIVKSVEHFGKTR